MIASSRNSPIPAAAAINPNCQAGRDFAHQSSNSTVHLSSQSEMWASSGAERLTSINGITSAKVIGREMSAEVSARSGKPIQLATSINNSVARNVSTASTTNIVIFANDTV